MAADGCLPFNEKSTSESIRETFGMSKKAFKQAWALLIKAGEVTDRFETEHLTLRSKWNGQMFIEKIPDHSSETATTIKAEPLPNPKKCFLLIYSVFPSASSPGSGSLWR